MTSKFFTSFKKSLKILEDTPMFLGTILAVFRYPAKNSYLEPQIVHSCAEEFNAARVYSGEKEVYQSIDYDNECNILLHLEPAVKSYLVFDPNEQYYDREVAYVIAAIDLSYEIDTEEVITDFFEYQTIDRDEYPLPLTAANIIQGTYAAQKLDIQQVQQLSSTIEEESRCNSAEASASFIMEDFVKPHRRTEPGWNRKLDFAQDYMPAKEVRMVDNHIRQCSFQVSDGTNSYEESASTTEHIEGYDFSHEHWVARGTVSWYTWNWAISLVCVWVVALGSIIFILDCPDYPQVYNFYFFWTFLSFLGFIYFFDDFEEGALKAYNWLFLKLDRHNEINNLELLWLVFRGYEAGVAYVCLKIISCLDFIFGHCYRYITGIQIFALKESLSRIRTRAFFSIFFIFFNQSKFAAYGYSLTHIIFSNILFITILFFYGLLYFFYFFMGAFHEPMQDAYFATPSKLQFALEFLYGFTSTLDLRLSILSRWSEITGCVFLEAAPVSYSMETIFIFLSIFGLFYTMNSNSKIDAEMARIILRSGQINAATQCYKSAVIYKSMSYYVQGAAMLGMFKIIIPIYAVLTIFYIKSYWEFFYYGEIFGRFITLPAELNSTDSAIINTTNLADYFSSTERSTYRNQNLTNLRLAGHDRFFESKATGGLNGAAALTFFVFKSCLLVVGWFVLVSYYQYYYVVLIMSDRDIPNPNPLDIDKSGVVKNTYSSCSGVTPIPRPEFGFSIVFSIALSIFCISAANSLVTVLVIECLTISTCYSILNTTALGSVDAAVKYFTVSAVASCIMLYGAVLLFSVLGHLEFVKVAQTLMFQMDPEYEILISTAFILFVISFVIKLSIFPLATWVFDVYDRCDLPTLFLITTFSKFFFLFLFYKFFYLYGFAIFSAHGVSTSVICAFGSIVWGSCCLVTESRIRRFFALSSVVNFGHLLLMFALLYTNCALETSVLFLLNYAFSTSVLFSILSRYAAMYKLILITDFQKVQLDRTHATFCGICLLSIAGIPPFLGFFSKVFLFNMICSTHLPGIVAIVIMIFSIPAYMGYFRVIRNFFYLKTPKGVLTRDEFLTRFEREDHVDILAWYLQDPISVQVYLDEFERLLKMDSNATSYKNFTNKKPRTEYRGTYNYFLEYTLNFTYSVITSALFFGHVTSHYIAQHIFILSKANTSRVHLLEENFPSHVFSLLAYIHDCLNECTDDYCGTGYGLLQILFTVFLFYILIRLLLFGLLTYLDFFWASEFSKMLLKYNVPNLSSNIQFLLIGILYIAECLVYYLKLRSIQIKKKKF